MRLNQDFDDVLAVLDRRLEAGVEHPVAVALSGGGDSLALLALAADWAARRGRRLLALTVDHGLNPDSGRWTAFAGEAARRLGAAWRSLTWEGEKPSAGLPAAARRARHALIAEAARAEGARVVLFGHTADDLAEAALMRARGTPVGDPREWSPSPAWPEGRGLMLLRPLLSARRARLRRLLAQRGLAWLEDPANADPRFARARARAELAGAGVLQDLTAARTPRAPSPADPKVSPWGLGVFSLPVDTPYLAEALLCAAGTDRPPRGARLARLRERLASGRALDATLAGARIVSDGERMLVCRDPGRAGLPTLELPAQSASVWDGRFEMTAAGPGWRAAALAGLQARLSPAERAFARSLPAPARPVSPVLLGPGQGRPVLASAAVRVTSLAERRFAAACGRIAHESELAPAPHGERTPVLLSLEA